MNVFLDRIRSSISAPEVCEVRFPSTATTRSVALTKSPLFVKACSKLLQEFKLRQEGCTETHASATLTLSGSLKASSLDKILNSLEPVVASAGWSKMEAIHSSTRGMLTLKFQRSNDFLSRTRDC